MSKWLKRVWSVVGSLHLAFGPPARVRFRVKDGRIVVDTRGSGPRP